SCLHKKLSVRARPCSHARPHHRVQHGRQNWRDFLPIWFCRNTMLRRNDYHHSLVKSLNFAAVVCAFAGASAIADLLRGKGLFGWPDTPAGALAGWPPDYVILLVSSLVSWSVVNAYFGSRESEHNIESDKDAHWRT